jgi:dihydrofolate synthase/folylpolyglutamate synthase
MTYEQALDYIHGTARFGIKPGLERISALLERMGNPHKPLRCVHIAGTNGKGSTSAMTERILREAGYTTGLCISPYLIDFCERIQLNGKPISRDELALRTAFVKTAVEAMIRDGLEHPT